MAGVFGWFSDKSTAAAGAGAVLREKMKSPITGQAKLIQTKTKQAQQKLELIKEKQEDKDRAQKNKQKICYFNLKK